MIRDHTTILILNMEHTLLINNMQIGIQIVRTMTVKVEDFTVSSDSNNTTIRSRQV